MPDYAESPILWWTGFNMRIVKVKYKGDLDYRYIFEENKQDSLGNPAWTSCGQIKYDHMGDLLINTIHTLFDIIDRDGFEKYTGPEEIS
jgi:hypothetical protein